MNPDQNINPEETLAAVFGEPQQIADGITALGPVVYAYTRKQAVADGVQVDVSKVAQEAGIRFPVFLIRFRLLDSGLKARLGPLVDDVAVPLSQFRRFDGIGLSVLITENKMTFLTLPPASEAIGIWGGGGAAELLASVEWLAGCRLFYWGDLDVHGFHILSRLRHTFPDISSLMMNERTLDLFANLAVPAREATYQHVSGLTSDERLAYHRLSSKPLLLEQEKIPHAHAVREILSLLGAEPARTTTSPGIAEAAAAPQDDTPAQARSSPFQSGIGPSP